MSYKQAMLVLLLVLSHPVWGEEKQIPWTQLSLSTCGVDKFHREHPDIDGRGVVIAILDTGVEMGVSGLRTTSTGDVKVIDVRDFTGEGDVSIAEIKYDTAKGCFVHTDEDGTPVEYRFKDYDKQPKGSKFWFGVLDEERFANSEVSDINDNGQGDDEFAVLVVAPPSAGDDDAVVYVDTNSNRDWSDDKPLQNYHVKFDSFQFAREKKERQVAPMTFSLNVYLEEKRVSFHFDDGGHGTHVAGIASGYRINGQADFNGVAPGAKVISLKIGHGTLAGGATVTGSKKKAFEYAAQYAIDHKVPVVCNLSYGIGSEMEGQSDIDQFLDRLCLTHPNLSVFSSAGNEGPGLSTIGTPTAASAVISIGALLAADSARDVMGFNLKGPQVAPFSSRGGELGKPNIAVPGWSTSTVPHWNRKGDFWSGTSMAGPYAAGMGAVMISGVMQKYPNVEPRGSWVKSALEQSAKPIEGFTALDYGAGIPDLTHACEVYTQLVSTLAEDILYDFDVSTTSPLAPGGSGPAAYWRSPYYPNDRSQIFTIRPRFIPRAEAEAVAAFSKQYQIKSDADWCKPRQEQVYFRSEQSATVRVDYDTSKLTQPGLYVATVSGVAEGQVGFRLVNTIAIPYTFGTQNVYQLALNDQQVNGWQVQRYFIAVPAGAGAMHLRLSAVEGKKAELRAYQLYKPDGSAIENRPFGLDTTNQKTEARWTITDELEPGVWELCLLDRRPDEAAHCNLEVRFSGVQAEPAQISSWGHTAGQMPGGGFSLLQQFEFPVPVKAEGTIEGFQMSSDQNLTPQNDTATRSITFNPEISAVRIECEFSKADYAKFTDVSLNVFDAKGSAIAKEGMTYRKVEMKVDNPSPDASGVNCNLEIKPAFALEDEGVSATAKVKLTYMYKNPIEIKVTGSPMLYPGIASRFRFNLENTPPQTPNGTVTVGSIQINNSGSGDNVITIPIEKK